MPPTLPSLSLLTTLAREGAWGNLIHRAIILDSCPSTQDEARRIAAEDPDSAPGTFILAAHQTSGRGRLGRTWTDSAGHGVAATFILDAGPGSAFLSLAAGLAACRAADLALPQPRLVGLRWPNDVVHRESGRKLAGVLVETSPPLAFVGIGINVSQSPADWPADLAPRATSLRELGSDWPRLRVADALCTMLTMYLARPAHELAQSWKQRDTLVGTTRTFTHDNATFTGEVLTIDPLNRITLRLPDTTLAHLPALTTSLVHD